MNKNIQRCGISIQTMGVMMVLLGVISLGLFSFDRAPGGGGAAGKDSAASVRAFAEVYKVLKSPRCMNCHPSGDQPLQGEDSHVHTMNVQRGEDGKGLYALKCSNCHQSKNVPGLHTPPGNPKWQLPPADMKMVFQGKDAHELAKQIMDYNQNGHKNKAQLIEHARDTLVKAAWRPGEGRKLPPLSYPAFLKAWDAWIGNGGYAPGGH
ncbi:MAG: hypothetical protein JST68_02440 [Bacteroidetes bacterium]|nr:hypothetical protein [Bacteroidota bacterium]